MRGQAGLARLGLGAQALAPLAIVSLGLLPAIALGLTPSTFGAAAQAKGDTVTVTRKTTKLRNAKRTFAPSVADLQEGDRLLVDAAEGAWFEVTFTAPAGSLKGFVHGGDVSKKKDVRLSGDGVRENYSASEAAAARKGFNPDVEREHRTNNPALEPAFDRVDAIQARIVTDAELLAFLSAGGLGGMGGGR